MEVIIVVLAIWLALIGVYSAWPYVGAINLGALFARPRSAVIPPLQIHEQYNEQIAAATAVLAQPELQLPPRPVFRASMPDLSSEVDMLRAQVERLRSELDALSTPSPAQRLDRPRLRRYRTGVYTYLPRPLRQQVREVRLNRRAFTY